MNEWAYAFPPPGICFLPAPALSRCRRALRELFIYETLVVAVFLSSSHVRATSVALDPIYTPKMLSHVCCCCRAPCYRPFWIYVNIKSSIFSLDPDKHNLALSTEQLPTLLRAATLAFWIATLFDNLLIPRVSFQYACKFSHFIGVPQDRFQSRPIIRVWTLPKT